MLGSAGNHLRVLLLQISCLALYRCSKLLLSFPTPVLWGAYVDTRSSFFSRGCALGPIYCEFSSWKWKLRFTGGGDGELSLLSWYVKLSCYNCETSPVNLCTAQSTQYRHTDWIQIGTFLGVKYSLYCVILSMLQPIETLSKHCRPPPPQLVWLLLHGFIPAQSKASVCWWKSGSHLLLQQGQGLAAGGSVHFVKQDIKIPDSSWDAQASPLLPCPFPRAVTAQLSLTESLFWFFPCSGSNLAGVGWLGRSLAGFLQLTFLLLFTPAMLSPAPKSLL